MNIISLKSNLDESSMIHGLNNELIADYLAKFSAHLIPADFIHQNLSELAGQFSVLFYRGNLHILKYPSVSVIGTRNPTPEGIARTQRVVSTLVDLGYVVLSGLAKGVDTVAHRTTLEQGGMTAAAFGTPIHKIYPAENRALASEIEKTGILISPARPSEESGRYLFPRRNRLMALISQATIIVEAGEKSGVIHQAKECLRQRRKLLLLKSLVDNKNLTWPDRFAKSGGHVIESTNDLRKLLLTPISTQKT